MTDTRDHADLSVDSEAVDPESVVGRYVRRRDARSRWRYTPWAQVSMTVPSAAGLCWLVSFIDGNVDVWRVDDPHAQYQFHPG